ncbi:MAG TPA: sugar phosphate isomerase/epimerase family protein [Candidatus Methylomirabilis sp.]|nr:sugar phosphate isomerase/epimerase family protein [Candidatus Methylomirabilis sp.]
MKLGCICGTFNRSFDAGSMNQIGFLARCATDLKVQGVELQDIHFPQTRPAYLHMVRRTAGDLGLAIIGLGVHNDFGRADPTLRQSEVVKVKQWIEVAERLGAPLVRVFAGYPEGNRQARWPAMIDSLREAAGFARQAGLRLGLENHNHGAFTPTAAEYLRVLEQVSSPGLVPLLDTGNFVDGWPSVEKTLPIAAHVHAKFWQVAGDGSDMRVDYGRIVPGLRAAGFDGWVSFEYETSEPEETGIPRALAYLKRMLAG